MNQPSAGQIPPRLIKAANGFLTLCAVASALAAALAMAFFGLHGALIPLFTVLFAASIGARFSRPEWRLNLALVGVASGVAVFLGNLLLVALKPDSFADARTEAARLGISFDTRSRHQVVGDLRAQGIHAYPSFHSSELLTYPEYLAELKGILPLAGVSKATTVLCNESGKYVTYGSDRFGFRNDDRAYDNPRGIEILLLGDSYASGECVGDEHTPAWQLNRLGRGAITLGIGGNGPLATLGSMIEYGSRLRPRTVMWLFYPGNDIVDLEREATNPILRGYRKGERQNLAERQPEIDATIAQFIDRKFSQLAESRMTKEALQVQRRETSWRTTIKDVVTVAEFRRMLRLNKSALSFEAEAGALDELEAILSEANATASSWGSRFVFVYLPDWQSLASSSSSRREAVLERVRRQGIPVVDFHETLVATGDPMAYFPFRLNGHFTEQGYALLAESLASAKP